MSGAGSFVAGTIEEILVALAQGIRDAQDRLNAQEPFDEYGRPKPQYYLPYLDFALKINAVETQNTGSNPAAPPPFTPLAQGRSIGALGNFSLRAAPMNFAIAGPSNSSSSSTNEVYSTISGRFVAVPPNDAMPQVTLTVTATPASAGKQTVTVFSNYAAGGPVRGANIEFNADPVSTASINDMTGPLVLSNTNIFQSGTVTTDAAGVAATVVDLTALPAGVSKVMVVANLGPLRASILVADAG
jgi:hypothetical protein